MVVSEGTRSKTGEVDNLAITMQEILKRLESLDSRMSIMESATSEAGAKNGTSMFNTGDAGDHAGSRGNYALEGGLRLSRLEFPAFDGTRVTDWIFKGERFFELDGTPPALKVSLASAYLTGAAMEWHFAFVKNRKLTGPISWEEYSTGMLMRFASDDGQKPIALLKKLKEEDSFFDYVEEFVALVSRVELSDEDQVALFIEGLKGTNRRLVTVLNPQNLQQAIAIAKTLSGEEESGRETVKGPDRGMHYKGGSCNVMRYGYANSQRSNQGNRQGQSSGVSSGSSGGSSVRSNPYQPPHRRVSPAEMEDRRSKGLCFWCDEKYTFNHKCPNKRLYTLILEPEAGEPEVIEEELKIEHLENEAVISLHALHGVHFNTGNQTMKLLGYYKKRRLHISVDSGSTHNFIDLETAKRMGCPTHSIGQHHVMVTDGNMLKCSSVCRTFKWIMQGVEFETQVLLMPLKGCELILGMEWLSSLGVVKWDFSNLVMEFECGGQSVRLQSVKGHSKELKVSSLAALKEDTGLFLIQNLVEKGAKTEENQGGVIPEVIQ